MNKSSLNSLLPSLISLSSSIHRRATRGWKSSTVISHHVVHTRVKMTLFSSAWGAELQQPPQVHWAGSPHRFQHKAQCFSSLISCLGRYELMSCQETPYQKANITIRYNLEVESWNRIKVFPNNKASATKRPEKGSSSRKMIRKGSVIILKKAFNH